MTASLPNPCTRMTPQWVAEALRMNPVRALLNSAGQPDGNFLTCPVRLGYNSLFEPEKPSQQGDGTMSEGGKYVAQLRFPVGADLSVLLEAWRTFAYQKFPETYNATDGHFYGLREPLRKQDEKCMTAPGFMPGGFFIKAATKRQPPVVMPGNGGQWMPVTDPRKVYGGVWGIATINLFSFNNKGNKGCGWGLQNLCLISDDERFPSRGGRDAQKDFAGVSVAPGADFSQMMANAPMASGAPSAPMGIMPAPTPVYQQPAAPLAVPGLPPAAPALTAEQEELRSLGLPY